MIKFLVLLTVLLFSLELPHILDSYEFDAYVTKFEKICHVKVNVPITLKPKLVSPVGVTWAGLCKSYGKYGEIEIDENYWNAYSYYGKEQLIFHELGHCVLHRPHSEEVAGTIPASIMYPIAFGDRPEYKENLEYYYKELCQ